MALNVAVIGAGAVGLVTARELLRTGCRVTVLEQAATVAGVWAYTPQTDADPLGRSGERVHSSLYASLRANLPRDLIAPPMHWVPRRSGIALRSGRRPGVRC
jgi:cation diffusion facilitator CzcD-associated flavoprotein CzcO